MVRRIAMKPLSAQFKDLSERAKKAEDDATAARSQQLQTGAAQRKPQAEATVSAQDAIARRWASLQAQLKTTVDEIQADIGATEAAAERAERKAERAEDNAACDIAYAKPAVIESILAWSDADAAAV
jgi:hypothetical protein